VPTLHDLLPPWVDLQLESYANGRQAPVWMWMPIFAIVHRRGGGVGFPHSPSAGAARSRTKGTCAHPYSHPCSHHSHPCSQPCAHPLQVHLYALTHNTTVLGTQPARERRALAMLVLRALQHATRHSPQGPVPLTRTETGGSRSWPWRRASWRCTHSRRWSRAPTRQARPSIPA